MFRRILDWLMARLRPHRPAPDEERFVGEGWTPEMIAAYKRMVQDLLEGR